MKSLKALFVFALGLAVASATAYAETQNVKVSGSLDAYGIYRNNYDLNKANGIGMVPAGTVGTGGTNIHNSDSDQYFMSITQVEVAADLTDNVSTVVNIVNQRDWNADQFNTATSNTNQEFDLGIDLAYVQMKEIFYSPLTLTVGRQDIWFGRGFIIGNNNRAWDPQGTIAANEYSVTTAFDAIRATLDFNPWTIDAIYSKINEGSINNNDDIDLYGVNVNYKFAEYNAVAEGYWFGNYDRNALVAGTGITQDDSTQVIGGRVQFDPISQITIGGELAYQYGNYYSSVTAPKRSRDAWGADVFGTYRFDYTWKPEVTLEYVHFGGDSGTTGSTGSYGGWNSLYRGKFWTAYADFREFVYGTTDANDQSATTNEDFFQLKGAFKPMEDLMLEGSATIIRNAETVNGTSKDLGWEMDWQATYDYTEDVSFGLVAGWFFPGSHYASPNDATAADIVSSVKVTF